MLTIINMDTRIRSVPHTAKRAGYGPTTGQLRPYDWAVTVRQLGSYGPTTWQLRPYDWAVADHIPNSLDFHLHLFHK
jgi:hypothetical protein